jgi:hypothetical protein
MKPILKLAFALLLVSSTALHSTAQNVFPSTGNVGIGTTTPDAPLVVNGNTRVLSNLVVGGDLAIPSFYQLWLQGGEMAFSDPSQGTDQKLWAVINQGGRFRIMTVNDADNAIQDAFFINRSGLNVTTAVFPVGNVLIGETTQVNSAYKLDVNGNVRATKLVVNTTGADFVFDSTYHLPALSATEKYILTNHHLPDIAPAAQMRQQGVDLGDNQTKLLQKIEELTLYMIEQQKQIASLQSQLTELKASSKK